MTGAPAELPGLATGDSTLIPKSSSIRTQFPMVGKEVLKDRVAGVYRWGAVGANGCTGSASTTFSVK
jgi:hypothetical protein